MNHVTIDDYFLSLMSAASRGCEAGKNDQIDGGSTLPKCCYR